MIAKWRDSLSLRLTAALACVCTVLLFVSIARAVGPRNPQALVTPANIACLPFPEPTITEYNGETPAEISLGGAFGNRSKAYVAVMLPLRSSFRVLAEYDSHRVSAALEFRPVAQLWTRWIHRSRQSLWSVTLEQKF